MSARKIPLRAIVLTVVFFCGFLCICLMFLYPVYLDHPCNYIVLLVLEITAANKSNVCTFAVLGPQQVPQPVSIQPANRISA